MKTYTFVRKENDQTGELGWKATWMENADPAAPMQCTHDILEHAVDTRGWAEGEFQAMGAIVWGRGQGGFFHRHPIHPEPGAHLGSDIGWILPRVFAGEESVNSPGRTHRIDDDWVEEQFDIAIKQGFKDYRENNLDNGSYPRVPGGITVQELQARIKGWLRKGYRAAVNLYEKRYGLDSYTVMRLFEQLQKAFETFSHEDEGAELTVKLDLRHADFNIYSGYPEDEYA